MKVIHVPFCFHPDPMGGTEIYVEQLCQSLEGLGVHTIIAAPASDDTEYIYKRLQVQRFAITQNISHIRELYDGAGDSLAAKRFTAILEREQPDIVHFHAFNRGASLRMLAAARARSISTVFTYHLPGISCQRGTLLRWGTQVCSGELRTRLCASCSLHGHGLGRTFSLVAGHTPLIIGRTIERLGLSGGKWTALEMSALIEMRHTALRRLMAQVDAIVTPCLWARDLLVENRVDQKKILLSRHGIIYSPTDRPIEHPHSTPNDTPLRVAFMGRLYPIKGPDLVIEGMRRYPDAAIHLDLYGVVQDEGSAAYLSHLRHLASSDPRILFHPSVPNQQIIPLLSTYDLLVVPSQVLETGPLVVLEAFAAGTPVIGSRLGGIAELISHNIDGLLIDHASADSWGRVLRDLAYDRDRVNRLHNGVCLPRRMEHVAVGMLGLYDSLRAIPSDASRLQQYMRGAQ